MKNHLLFSLLIILPVTLFCQAPEGFSYQALIRDNTGNPIGNNTVSFRLSIIKGDVLGELVYSETHNVITDAFGSVSLVIGTGNNITGIFSAIDWGNDSYFLKTEIDKSGGSSYIEMGTSQLLSVPYALYSKIAGNGFSGNYNDLTNRPVTDGSETKVISGSNISVTGTGTDSNPYRINNGFSGNYNDLTGKPVTDGSETNIQVDDNLEITGRGTVEEPYIIKERIHNVGENYGGGIVFYVYDRGRHGLIASVSDQEPGIEWYNGVRRYTNTAGDGIRSGEMNTALIIAMQTNDNPMSNFAAKVCADYSVTVDGVSYGDWYLPSKFELALLYLQKDFIGNFTGEYYWSSSEFSSISAWAQNFSTGVQYNLNKSLPYSVRAVRAF